MAKSRASVRCGWYKYCSLWTPRLGCRYIENGTNKAGWGLLYAEEEGLASIQHNLVRLPSCWLEGRISKSISGCQHQDSRGPEVNPWLGKRLVALVIDIFFKKPSFRLPPRKFADAGVYILKGKCGRSGISLGTYLCVNHFFLHDDGSPSGVSLP
jgi:hypothetical protein